MCLTLGCGNAWYSVEAVYSSTSETPYTIALAIAQPLCAQPAKMSNMVSAATDSTTPTPWITLLAISSPRVYARIREVPIGAFSAVGVKRIDLSVTSLLIVLVQGLRGRESALHH